MHRFLAIFAFLAAPAFGEALAPPTAGTWQGQWQGRWLPDTPPPSSINTETVTTAGQPASETGESSAHQIVRHSYAAGPGTTTTVVVQTMPVVTVTTTTTTQTVYEEQPVAKRRPVHRPAKRPCCTCQIVCR